MKRYLIMAVLILFARAGTVHAQELGVKTNALYWATATPNVGLEYAFADRWTVELTGGWNPWTFDSEKNMKAKHYLISPEVRYWFCESFNGHFIGIGGNFTQFNIGGIPVPGFFVPAETDGIFLDKLKNSRSEGWAAGAGVTYGYAFPISRRWSMEAKIGAGVWYSKYDSYETRPCGLFHGSNENIAFGITDIGISFIYLMR